MTRGLLLVLAIGALPACSTIGDPGGMPRIQPHGGTGQFRLLENGETGISGNPGRALALSRTVFQSGMAADARLFYASGRLLDMPPMLPVDFPENEVFFDAFEPLEIHRGEAREEGTGAFAFGPTVLSATEAWEGASLFDPWVFVDEDGTARLYYAAEAGIGLAEASSIDGTFAKIGSGPVLDATAAARGAPRRPSVIRGTDDAIWMYYDAGGEIRAARSDDGQSFTPMGPIVLVGEDEGISEETSIANPGALRVELNTGRTLIRLYFESIRDDGAHDIYVAGSEDGLAFERFVREVIDHDDTRFPSPLAIDRQTTFMYASHAAGAGEYETRSMVVSASPRTARFDPPEE